MKNNNLILNTFKTILVGFTISVLIACSGKNGSKTEKGGVDGSGGDLASIHPENFKKYLAEDHLNHMSTLIHRLQFLKEFSTKDLDDIPKDLLDRLMGSDPKELKDLLSKVTFYMVDGPCPSQHPHGSDSSVTSDGRICFSYQAFKNIPDPQRPVKLFIMTLHELSHLQGFNEFDAFKLQKVFDKNNSRLTLLTNLHTNLNYQNFRESIGDLAKTLASALDEYQFGYSSSSCAIIESINDIINSTNRAYNSSQFNNIPRVFLNKYSDEVKTALSALNSRCLEGKSGYSLGDSMVEVINRIISLNSQMEQFENKACAQFDCYIDRENGITSAMVASKLWTGYKIYKIENVIDYINKEEVATCELIDLDTNSLLPMIKDTAGVYSVAESLQCEYSCFAKISFEKKTDYKWYGDPVIVKIQPPFGWLIKNSDGFYTHVNSYGVLFPEVNEEISMEFSTLKESVFHPPSGVYDNYDFNYDPKQTIGNYKLTCRLM